VRRYVYVHPRVYQYSGTKKNFFTRRACALTRYVHLSSTTYVVPEPLEALYVPSKRTSSLNRERYAMAVRGDGQNFPLRESYPQWYPPHCSPPDVVPYRLRRRRTWWWTGPPLTGGVYGGGGCTIESRPADLPKNCSEVEQPTGRLYTEAPSGPVRR